MDDFLAALVFFLWAVGLIALYYLGQYNVQRIGNTAAVAF